MRPVIHSTKHQVQFPFSAITTGLRVNLLIAQAVATADKDLASEVEEGSIIKAVYVEMWLLNTGNDGHAIVILEKVPDGSTGANATEMASLFTYTNKKNIFYTHEGLTNNDGIDPPRNILNRWIKIPKSKQRFGLGDRLVLTISNPSAGTLNRCGQTVFKEYT